MKGKKMKMKKSLILKLGLVISLFVVNAYAATPGSRCTLSARILGVASISVPGVVNNAGNACLPSIVLPPLFKALQTGFNCGVTSVIGLIVATASCPN